MGEAMISGLANAGVPMSKVRVIELSNDRRKYLREKFGNEIVLFREYVDDMFRGVVRSLSWVFCRAFDVLISRMFWCWR
jgi:pyrroline-5-carboxylate reductase